MATLVLSAAGGAIGSAIGGSFLGFSAAVIGRAVGATIGRAIDQKILGGSSTVETGKIDRFRLTGASEGAPVAKVHGRIRVGGQVIWASRFTETVTTSGGGKGGPSQPEVKSYSYSVSLAIALAEGPINRVGRIWADGVEIAKSDVTLRVYSGSEDQLPDAKIEAVEGAGEAPAYRGIAYVVFEDLALERFGNRVPQFSFEVIRTSEDDLAAEIEAVALIPGSGEYALATTPVTLERERGVIERPNVNTPEGIADIEVALEALTGEAPNCGAVSLIVSWFGDDLRCGSCGIRPKVEQTETDGKEMPWRVSGVDRASAGIVPIEDGRPLYGGTPSDASVIEAIAALKAAGQAVMFYPFILMEQVEGNGLPDPYGGAEQARLPWRGRITTSFAADQPGTPDGTAAADAEVEAFFGTAAAGDFSVSGTQVDYLGSESGYRRFVLHQAHLCAAAGGVEAFCVGSEMRGLTRIRGANGSFPAVAALKALAAEVRTILGPGVRIGYAADWSEYFGYQPQDGSGDVYFHLDPLWADPNINFIGIDNYMPLSDWRDGSDHADAGWGAIHDIGYLRANILGGEGYDWFYETEADRAAQIRTPITDGAFGEPWVYRYKDVANWWANAHHERIGGVRQSGPTAWVPESKPIWFTEFGCAAIDKGTNQPNKFLDPKSSESALPYFSSGARDDFIQQQYLRAQIGFWQEPANNPISSVYSGRMIDTTRLFAWAWDARPYPQFPTTTETWSDGENYRRGHWLNGRVTSRALATVAGEVCLEAGVPETDMKRLYGIVRGYALEGGETAREALQPLMLANGADAMEAGGKVVFRTRSGMADLDLDVDGLALDGRDSALTLTRVPEAETAGRVRLSHVEADGNFEIQATESAFPDEETVTVSQAEMPLSLTGGEAKGIVERWLGEARVARDVAGFSLPPSVTVGAGDVVRIVTADGTGQFRIDRVEEAGVKRVEAVRVEEAIYAPPYIEETPYGAPGVRSPGPVWATIMDLPILREEGGRVAPWVAATGDPWPGGAAVYSSDDGESWAFETEVVRAAAMGETLTALPRAEAGYYDRGAALEVRMVKGALQSIGERALLNGGNVAAIGAPGMPWEIIQFRKAELTGPRTWALSERLRGQLGTDGVIPDIWAAGSVFVLLDTRLRQLPARPALRGIQRQFRIGPSSKPVDDASYSGVSHTSEGIENRPYRPVHLTARRGLGGAIDVGWVRQTRIDGDGWRREVPLGETEERYLLRISEGAALKREVEVTEPVWSYTAAMQSSDGVSAAFTVEVAQVSDRYGPGLFGRIEVNG